MATVNGRTYTRAQLLPYVGSMAQICGTRQYMLTEGRAQGARAIDLWTGSGLELTVLPDRAMDIPSARYKGCSLCFQSKSGITASPYYEPAGDAWFRSYFAGLLTTCGLSNTGAACEVDGVPYGLHGRIANTPAEKVRADEVWDGDEYGVEISGSMREAVFYGENLVLQRRITARMGEKRFFIHDTVRNEGYSAVPLFLLYHFNAGFPLLCEDSELLLNAARTQFYDDAARDGATAMHSFQKPTPEYFRQVFLHTLREDPDGWTTAAVVNRRPRAAPLGLSLRFNRRQLPEFFTFKMMGQGDYQLGLEPSNCLPMGRAFEKSRGGWKLIQPQTTLSFDLEICVLDGAEEIRAMEETLRGLR